MPEIKLRPFQVEAENDSIDSLLEHGSTLLQAPTGAGKTIIACAIMDWFSKRGFRTIFLAPRRELVDQAADKLEMFGYRHGYDFGIYMAGEESSEELLYLPMQVASKDTLVARLRKDRVELPRASLVIVDEAHLSLAPTWLKLIKDFQSQGALIYGMTATPARGDGRGLGLIYKDMIKCPTVADLMDMGFLCPAKYYAPTTPDLEGVRINKAKHDYKEADLEKVMSEPTIIGDIISNWQRLAAGKRTIVFCAGVKHSILVRDKFIAEGIAAEHVDGNTPTEDRNEIFKRVRSGETQVLTNCLVATYGTDLPDTECLVLARPTKSIIMHLQTLGRGLRVAPGKKYVLVLDHAGNTSELGFAHDYVDWSLEDDHNVYDMINERKKEEEKEDREGITCQNCSLVYEGQRACPECDWEPPEKRGKDIKVVDGELEEKSGPSVSNEEIKEFYLRMRGLFRDRNKNENRAYHLTKQKFGVEPPIEWRGLPAMDPDQAVLGYEKYDRIRYAKSKKRKFVRKL